MQLSDLEKAVNKVTKIQITPSSQSVYLKNCTEIDRRRKEFAEQRRKEDISIAKGECPECGHPLNTEKSRFSTFVIYHTCQNPDKSLGHVFIR
jgi:hypothetical protein